MLSLRPYQEQAADFLYEHDRALVLAPVGSGKTAITLTAMHELTQAEGIRWLVLAPLRVAEHVWPVEVKKWTPDLPLAVAVGAPTRRIAALYDRDADVVVTNYDNIQWLADFDLSDFTGVVFDELTRLKDPSGKRFKALEKAIKHIDIRWGLTGSFTSNGLIDVFGQCKIVDQKLLGRSKGAFLQQYFYCINRDFGDWTPMPGALEAVMQRIKPATFLLEGASTDRALHVVPMLCEMDLREYDTMKKNFVVEFPDVTAVAASAGVVTQKLQQMACIAHDTPVLTDAGWLPIQHVLASHRVWDGQEWVAHDGCVLKGVQQVISCYDVNMTYNHRVLTAVGWRTAQEVLNGDASERFDRLEVRLPDGYTPPRNYVAWLRYMVMPMRLRGASSTNEPIFTGLKTFWKKKLWVLSQQHKARHDRQSAVQNLVQHAQPVLDARRQRLRPIWGRRHKCLSILGGIVRSVLGRYATWVCRSFDFGSDRWVERLLQVQLPMGNYARATEQSKKQCVAGHSERPHDSFASRQSIRPKSHHASCAPVPVQVGLDSRAKYARTYDLLNCGPRNRFVVRGGDGQALIVHNCGFIYTPEPRWLSHHKFEMLDDILAENQGANTVVFYNYIAEHEELKRRYPHVRGVDALEDWNAGRVRLLALHPKSAGHGLNLQAGGHHIVFLTLPWSLELYEQAIGRLHRSGQQHDVWVYVLTTRGTIDEKILSALKEKRSMAELAVEALK